jgi:putative acetyltransferase
MSTFSVRAEREGEADLVRSIEEAAFGRPLEADIVDAMRGTDDWLKGGSMLAIDEYKKAAGHVLVSRGRLERVGEEPLALAMLGPIGVLPDRQGEGAGTALMRAAISYATQRHFPLLCLAGDPAYYRRFKFEPGRAVGIEPAVDYPDENWLVLRLIDWTPGLRGVAHFPPPFPAGPAGKPNR